MVSGFPLLLIMLETLGVVVVVMATLAFSCRALLGSKRYSNRSKLLGAFLILGFVPVLGGLALTTLPDFGRSAGAMLIYAIFAAAADVILGIWISRTLFRPVTRLVAAVEKIAAEDSPGQPSPIAGDEWKILTLGIDAMVRRQQKVVQKIQDQLEARSRENMQLAEKSSLRAVQLQNLSDVAQAITAQTDLDQLFNTVTQMISSRFGFHHVGIYTVGGNKDVALLRAANSEAGQRTIGQALPVLPGSSGIISEVIQTGLPKIRAEGNPADMPLTRSEIALPLMNGKSVIGAIDLHSENPDTFAAEDIHLYSVLADQVAIALANNRLYTDTRKALAEAQEIHSRYLRQEWKRENQERRYKAFQYHLGTVQPAQPLTSPEVLAAFSTGEVNIHSTGAVTEPAGDKTGFVGTTLAVPIKLRDIVIGVINLQEIDPRREWNKAEIEMVKAVADQIAIAVENARLLEQTLRRASRERTVFEITSKLRAINDPESMVKTAVAELRSALGADRAQVIIHSLPGLEAQNRGQDSSDQTKTSSTS